MPCAVVFFRQSRRAERALREGRAQKPRGKPSVSFRPEESLISNGSEVITEPKVQSSYSNPSLTCMEHFGVSLWLCGLVAGRFRLWFEGSGHHYTPELC